MWKVSHRSHLLLRKSIREGGGAASKLNSVIYIKYSSIEINAIDSLVDSFQQNAIITNVSFDTLPVELVHRIFDFSNTQTILGSIRCVCRYLYASVNAYNRFELVFDPKSTSDFQSICRIIPMESVTSLHIISGNRNEIRSFHRSVEVHRLTRLRSLNLHRASYKGLKAFFSRIVYDSLVSLSITSSESYRIEIWTFISTMIAKFKPRKLCLYDFNHTNDLPSWPVNFKLEHLEIGTCRFDQYITILNSLPYLRTISIKDCIMQDNSDTIALNSKSTLCTALVSLTMVDYSLSKTQFELLVSMTPKLVHLKLVSRRRRISDYVFDGSYWENYIPTELPSLNKFEFFFSSHISTGGVNSLNLFIAPFQSQFWIKQKQWLISCAYVPKRHEFWLYTTQISTVINSSLRFEVLATDGLSHVITSMRTDITIDKVFTGILL